MAAKNAARSRGHRGVQVRALWSDAAAQGQDLERFDEETGRLRRSEPKVGLREATDAREDKPGPLRQSTYRALDFSAQIGGWRQPERKGAQVMNLRKERQAPTDVA
jgi:hypothetical protein